MSDSIHPKPTEFSADEVAADNLLRFFQFLRAERGIKGSTATKEDIADEMGDLLVSLDLLANQLGIDLGRAVERKFNATSTKYGMRTYIDGGDWHLKAAE